MWRSGLLFGAAVLVALTAGRAFWVSLGENPFDVPGATYVDYFQRVDGRIAIPIAVTGLGGTLITGLAALAHRLASWGWPLIDAQVENEHLLGLGAQSWPRTRFLAQVADLTALPGTTGSWTGRFGRLAARELAGSTA